MKLSELFDIEICKNPISKDFALDNPGRTPYITTTSENNGIECYVDYPPQYQGGLITVSKDGGNGDAFLQQLPFCGNEKIMVLTPKRELSKKELFYYVSVIKFNKTMFGYGRKCSVARLEELHIPVPEEIPSFVYDIKVESITTENKLDCAYKLHPEEWKEFNISRTDTQSGLFLIESCKCGSAGDLDDGIDINYIGAKKNDNGVVRKVVREEALVSKGNGIMFICDGEGSVGYTNYMDRDFIGSTTTSVGYDEALNRYNALFLVSILDKEKFKYSYGRKYRAHINNTTIKLPIQKNENGNPFIDETKKYSKEGYVPDWQWMENYIKSLPYGDRI